MVTFQGPSRELAAEVASKRTNRALYRIRLTSRDKRPDVVLHQAMTLNEKWRSIILIEDLVESMETRTASERQDILRPLLHLLKNYYGITIVLLPDERFNAKTLDPLVKLQVSMDFVFLVDHPDDAPADPGPSVKV